VIGLESFVAHIFTSGEISPTLAHWFFSYFCPVSLFSVRLFLSARFLSFMLHFAFAQCDQGPMLWFFKYFRRKIQQKYWRFFAQTTASFFKNLIVTLVFENNANFFAENWQKTGENCDHNIEPRPPISSRAVAHPSMLQTTTVTSSLFRLAYLLGSTVARRATKVSAARSGWRTEPKFRRPTAISCSPRFSAPKIWMM
jgi:hypothetical protein